MIFIIHAEGTRDAATAVLEFLLETLDIDAGSVISSGVPGHLPPDNKKLSEYMKEHRTDTNAAFSIIGALGTQAAWFPFEIGAGWGLARLTFPILLPGAEQISLPIPLSACTCISTDEERAPAQLKFVHHTLCKVLDIAPSAPDALSDALDRLVSRLAGTPSSAATLTKDLLFKDGMPAKRDDSDGYTTIPVNVSKFGKPIKIAVKISWDDIYRTIAPNIHTLAEDALVESLLLSLCKEKEPELANGVAFKIMTDTRIPPETLQQIKSHYQSLGYVECASGQGKYVKCAATQWKLTKKGADYLSEIVTYRKQFQS